MKNRSILTRIGERKRDMKICKCTRYLAFLIAMIMSFYVQDRSFLQVQAEEVTYSYSVAGGTISYTLQKATSDTSNVMTIIKNEGLEGEVDLSGLDELADSIIIGESAFEKNANITSVILPNKTTEIGVDAFRECTKLITCDLVEGICKIEKGAFMNTAITAVTIPASCTLIDGGTTYADEDKYGSVWLGDNYGAFYGCKNLLNVTFAPRTTTLVLGSHLFENCTSLQELEFPAQVTSIPDGVCKGCSRLRKVVLPTECTVISGYAFYNCDIYELNIPDGCLSIGKQAFANNKHIGDVTFPSSCTAISDKAFTNCTGLGKLIFENADVALGTEAFPSISVAVNMVFYCDVSIYDNSPSKYAEVNGIQTQKKEEEEEKTDSSEDTETGNGTSSGGTGTETEKPSSGTGTENESQTPSDGTEIGGETKPDDQNTEDDGTQANGNGNANQSTTPNVKEKPEKGKTYTYKNMRYKVTGSKTVTFMKPVDKNVKKVTVPGKVKILGKWFKVTKINKKACYNYKKLTTVTIGNNVSVIGDQAFAKCKKLKVVTLGKGVTTIGKQSFAGDTSISKFKIRGTKLKNIKKGAFKGLNARTMGFTVTTTKVQKKFLKLINKKSIWK